MNREEKLYDELIEMTISGHIKRIIQLVEDEEVDFTADSYQAVFIATEEGHLDIVKYYLSHAMLEQVGLDSLLESSVESESLEIAKFLIEKGANPDAGMPQACQNELIEMVEYFVNKGADKSIILLEGTEQLVKYFEAKDMVKKLRKELPESNKQKQKNKI